MASSVFLDLGDQGGPFSGQMLGPAANNTAAPPYSFVGDATSGYASSAVGTLSLVTAGTTRLSISSTAVTSTVPYLAPDGTLANPSISFSADPDTGFMRSVANRIDGIFAGVNKIQWGNSVTNHVSDWSIGWVASATDPSGASDVSLSRGAADRLDLATGDSFRIVSGGLGVGTTTTGAGDIASSRDITAGRDFVMGSNNRIYGSSVSILQFVADGQANFTNNANSAGIGLNFSTDGVVLFKNRAQNAAGGIGFASLAVSGTAPTVTSAGTSPSIVSSNGTAAFNVNVGTGGTATTIVLAMPTATTGWMANAENITATAANRANQRVVVQSSTTTSLTLQNQTISTGAALAFTASDVVRVMATAY